MEEQTPTIICKGIEITDWIQAIGELIGKRVFKN